MAKMSQKDFFDEVPPIPGNKPYPEAPGAVVNFCTFLFLNVVNPSKPATDPETGTWPRDPCAP